ncbi:MAG TPA: glycine betaine ABC transporter substrate-binding protein, partial [Paraburkholderia sp.]|nr:glycine betaine ABC transporter substrate-binding protein [Paraburkholderia sp.]
KHAIRELKEPRGLLRGADEATLVIRHTLRDALPEAAVTALRDLTIGNADMTWLDHLVSREGLTPLEAGERYLERRAKPTPA